MQIVVMTSDQCAANVFLIFAKAFHHHWPDCPWPIVAVGETVSATDFPTTLQGISPPELTVVDRLGRYLGTYGGETIMVLLDDQIFYAHPINTPVLKRAHQVLLDDKSIGATLLSSNREPDKFYDGFLGEFVGVSRLSIFDVGLWRTPALRRWIEKRTWPRVLGTYHSPLVYVDLITSGMVSGAGIVGLEAHHSVVLELMDELVHLFGIKEIADLKIQDSPDVRRTLADLIERYGTT